MSDFSVIEIPEAFLAHHLIKLFYTIGIRNYQIIDKSDRGEDTNLVEIGPRMV